MSAHSTDFAIPRSDHASKSGHETPDLMADEPEGVPMSLDNDSSFELPTHNQAISPLFNKLPAEVCLMVYRELLIHDKPLSVDPRRARGDTTQVFQQQAWNLLLSCQMILCEALPIYFNENSVTMRVDGFSSCRILRTQIKFQEIFSTASESQSESLADRIWRPNSDSRARWEFDVAVLDRFNSFHVQIIGNDYRIYSVLHGLKEILYSKKVVVTLDALTLLQGLTSPIKESIINACRALRCKEFQISGGFDISEVKKMVEGRDPGSRA